jgi:hypothetical protein
MRIEDLEKSAAFLSPNGEYGWTRGQALKMIVILETQSQAILGGELWLVLKGSNNWRGRIPQREGLDAIYTWETERNPNEDWAAFVNRCAVESKAAVERLPEAETLPPNLSGRILYNLTWVSEEEYSDLRNEAV